MNTSNQGFLLVLILVFGSIFFVLIAATMGFVITQSKVQELRFQKERALDIAEAGLNYYKWFLAHNPDDTTNGTGLPGPYVHQYSDPEGDVIGSFSLDIASSSACGEVYAIDIYSTGYATNTASTSRTVYGRYARPTVTEYSYIINSNVWAGSDRTIVGPYHSNGIIRMDGMNSSTVSSGQEDWVCDGSLPCDPSPNGTTLDAVYGDGPNNALWNFPTPPINFAGLTVDLAQMQDKAENGGGVYIGPSGASGYLVDFQADGTFDLYRVDSTYSYWGYTTQDGWQQEQHTVQNSVFLQNYTIPPSCSLIFIEDKVWIQQEGLPGEITQKVTIAAADVDTPGVDPQIILNGNIEYQNDDSGLLAIAEDDVLVGLMVPTDMTLEGIFVAQNGRFGRNHYNDAFLANELDGYMFRNSLTIHGTIVSNERVGTKWTCGAACWASGFDTRFNSYDRDLVDDPPPLTPETSDNYEFIEWREMDE